MIIFSSKLNKYSSSYSYSQSYILIVYSSSISFLILSFYLMETIKKFYEELNFNIKMRKLVLFLM
jgi:hypothetical protein